MAESSTNVNFFQAMMNPQFAAQQLNTQRQQALAQQLMEEGSQQPPTDQLANPGGLVVPNSPMAALARALEKGAGAYIGHKALEDQTNSYYGLAGKQTPDQSPTGQGGAPLLPWQANALTGQPQGMALGNAMAPENPMSFTQQEAMDEAMQPGRGKAEFEARTAGQKASDTSGNTYTKDANGNLVQPGKGAVNAASTQPNPIPQANPAPVSPTEKATLGQMYDTKPETNVMPNKTDATPPQIPMAADGKPYIDSQKFYAPDLSGKATFNHENTDTGVADAKNKAESLNKENAAFSQGVANFKNEGNQIQNLVDIYKQTKGGTLIAQNPEIANKLVALGIIKDPSDISNVANVQAAMNAHILDTLRQVRDANTSIGGPTSRIMAGEINTMLEEGASVKDQPEAMFKILANAKGLVDYNMDMAKGWDSIGGTGNRAANGFTMPLSDFTTKYALNHDIQDYKTGAQKTIGPLKGMAGNNGGDRLSIIDPNGNAGTIDKAHLQSLLDAGGKLAQ